MIFNELDVKNLNTTIPNHNIKNDSFSEEYIYLYNQYRKLFSMYFMNKIELKKYDDDITNSEYKFLKLKKQNMDIYQYFTDEDLNFFYFRNNIYIDNLSDDEKERLKSFDFNNLVLDDAVSTFVENTYKKVISENLLDQKDAYIYFYSPMPNGAYMVRNNTFIIGFNYDDLNLNGMNTKDWHENYKHQHLFLQGFVEKMKAEISTKLDMPIEIIGYNRFNIVPMSK